MLIITKGHITCMGALDGDSFIRFRELYEGVSAFLNRAYGKIAAFEHGASGQTVPHAHMHLLPFNKSIREIVPEGESVREISSMDEIRAEFNRAGKYLYLAISDRKWLVGKGLETPGFFRQRFAGALGVKERGSWERARGSPLLMKAFRSDIRRLKDKWAAQEREWVFKYPI